MVILSVFITFVSRLESWGGTEPGLARVWLVAAHFSASSARARHFNLWLVTKEKSWLGSVFLSSLAR